MIQNNLKNEFDYYIECMAQSYIDMLAEKGKVGVAVEDIINDKEFIEQIENDLEDKGFASEEASSIATNSFKNEDVKYRVLAYCYLMYDDFDSIEKLKDIIENDSYSDLSEFTDEELTKILEASERVDF